jgi:hypothetical protein
MVRPTCASPLWHGALQLQIVAPQCNVAIVVGQPLRLELMRIRPDSIAGAIWSEQACMGDRR